MSRGIFITGTDTGVGKTVVAAGILRWLRKQGIDAVPMKPVQTGGERRGRQLVAPDLEFCLAAGGLTPKVAEKRLMSPYLYGPACSPHLAGRLNRSYPEIARIKECADRLLERRQAVIMEGAGGIMAPLDESATMLDLMKTMAYPVVLVARAGLGTINHTLLSLHALRAAGVEVIGVVFTHTELPLPELPLPELRFIEADNPPTIARFGKVRILGRIRHLDNLNPAAAESWDAFEEDMTGLGLVLDEINGR